MIMTWGRGTGAFEADDAHGVRRVTLLSFSGA
jgi:hypothetical protein